MIISRRLMLALLSVGLSLSSVQVARSQTLNDLANQFLRPQNGGDRDAARDAYERGRADAYREQRDREDLRGRDDGRRFRGDDQWRADEDRRRRWEDEQRRGADFDRVRPDEGRGRPDYGR